MTEPEEPDKPMVVAATDRPLPLAVRSIPDDRVPQGMACLASFLGERLIARCAIPPEAIDSLQRFGIFRDPVHLVLAAQEESPGLQCRLFALVNLPEDAFEEAEEEEPWAETLPGAAYEAAVREGLAEQPDSPRQAMVFLGQIVRFERDRQHRESLALEAADVLRRIVEGEATDVVDKVLEDLLGKPPGSALS